MLRAAVGPSHRNLTPAAAVEIAAQRRPRSVEKYGGGMLKLLRNVIILRAVWRMFKRSRRA
jgi:hypothetical protein